MKHYVEMRTSAGDNFVLISDMNASLLAFSVSCRLESSPRC